MKKVLAINSGSSSFKYKLFSFPDERVIASGMADRVGMENAVFKIKLSNGKEYIKNTAIPNQAAAVKLLMDDLKKFNVVKDLKEFAGVGHRVVNGGEIFKDSALIDQRNSNKSLTWVTWHHCTISLKLQVSRLSWKLFLACHK